MFENKGKKSKIEIFKLNNYLNYEKWNYFDLVKNF